MGKRLFFFGTMNASKSAQLLIQAFNLERQGKGVLAFKPLTDTRDGNYIKSRALDKGREAISIPYDAEGAMYDIVKSAGTQVQHIFVDEVQFMSENQVKELARISTELGKNIFAYGLMLSYNGRLFEGTRQIIECGFSMHELKIQCDTCSSKATHHLLYVDDKLITDGDQIHVGDEEYHSVCYPCYIKELNNM